MDNVTQVEFYKQAGQPIELRLNAPFLIEEAEKASLFIMSSPLKISKKKIPVETLKLVETLEKNDPIRLSNGRQIDFTHDVLTLMDAMSKGDWGVVELLLPSGVQTVIEIPAIDFINPLRAFNDKRNAFPMLGWEQGKEYTIHFDLARFELTDFQKKQLRELVELINYDGEVVSIEIDGHTDLSGHRLQNLTLSQQRTQAVKTYLSGQGLPESMFTAVRHHGQRYPLPKAGAAENRRVEIRLSR